MKTYAASFLVAFLASLVLTRFARDLGLRWNLTEAAWGRKTHRGRIPRLGGPAVALSFFLPVYGLLLWDNDLSQIWAAQRQKAVAMLVGSSAILLLGLVDDIRHLRARYKLLGQVGIAVLTYALGVRIRVVSLPILGVLDMGVFSLPVTVLWILAFVNALNLIDGMDGLCAGVTVIAAATTFATAILLGSPLTALFATALAGATLGFLRYNFNPASIFLGDSGSYFVGFVLAVASIVGVQKASVAVSILVPVLALGLPFTDTALAILRRAYRGLPIFAPDRGHIHHRLMERGYSTRRAVLVLYGLSSLLALGGLTTVIGQKLEAGVALVGSSAVIFLLIRLSGMRLLPGKGGMVEGDRFASEKAEQLLAVLPGFVHGVMASGPGNDLPLLLEDLARRGDFRRMDLTMSPSPDGPVFSWKWRNDARTDGGGRPVPTVSACYEIRRESARIGTLEVEWASEVGTVLPETHALLRLAVEVLGRYGGERRLAGGAPQPSLDPSAAGTESGPPPGAGTQDLSSSRAEA